MYIYIHTYMIYIYISCIHIYIYIISCMYIMCMYIYIHDIKHQNCSYDFVVGVLVLWDRWSTLIIRLRLVSIPFL